MRRLALAALMLVAACDTIPDKTAQLTGAWGGPHIGITFEGGLGRVEYDCASGTIDNYVIPGPGGRFSVTGTHRTGQGGPVRVGQIFTSERATYSGTVEDKDMTLTVTLEGGEVLGPFSLTEGAPPQITRCL